MGVENVKNQICNLLYPLVLSLELIKLSLSLSFIEFTHNLLLGRSDFGLCSIQLLLYRDGCAVFIAGVQSSLELAERQP